MKMKENGIEPRTLADDLFVFASGKNHEGNYKRNEIPLQFFQDIGAKVAKNKCFMTSSCEKPRKNQRSKILGEDGVPMQVINQFRDLDGHVCMDLTKSAETLNQRMERAIEHIHRFKWTKISRTNEIIPNQNGYTPGCALWE